MIYKDKEYMKKYSKQYRKLHKEYYKKYRESHKELYKEYYKKYSKNYYKNNNLRKKYLKEYYKRWIEKNPYYHNNYQINRLNNDINFKILKYCRNRLQFIFKQYLITGKQTSSKLYGIDYNKIIEKLTNELPKDYNEWNKNNPDNVWSIDHIKALVTFNFEDKEQIKQAFAPENYQWMKLKSNISKGKKLNWGLYEKKLY